MARIGAGGRIYEMRREIQAIERDLEALGQPQEMPEMVDSANMLRANDHLARTGQKRAELVAAYSRYCEALEEMLLDVFEIQKGLKEVLGEQSKMLARRKKAR